MIKNLQEIRHAMAVKLGLARSNEQRAQDQEGLEEREAFEALQAVEIDWQKANEGLRANLHRTQVAEMQEQIRERSAEKDAEQEIGGMFGKHARPLDLDEGRELVRDAENIPAAEKEQARKHTGLFAEKARDDQDQDRTQSPQELDDQAQLDAERARKKEAAIARVRARLARERQQDRSFDLSR